MWLLILFLQQCLAPAPISGDVQEKLVAGTLGAQALSMIIGTSPSGYHVFGIRNVDTGFDFPISNDPLIDFHAGIDISPKGDAKFAIYDKEGNLIFLSASDDPRNAYFYRLTSDDKLLLQGLGYKGAEIRIDPSRRQAFIQIWKDGDALPPISGGSPDDELKKKLSEELGEALKDAVPHPMGLRRKVDQVKNKIPDFPVPEKEVKEEIIEINLGRRREIYTNLKKSHYSSDTFLVEEDENGKIKSIKKIVKTKWRDLLPEQWKEWRWLNYLRSKENQVIGAKKYYQKHRDEILAKRREEYRKTHPPKKRGRPKKTDVEWDARTEEQIVISHDESPETNELFYMIQKYVQFLDPISKEMAQQIIDGVEDAKIAKAYATPLEIVKVLREELQRIVKKAGW